MKKELVEKLREDLSRRRELPGQVKRHLAGVHGVAEDEIGRFLTDRTPHLEEFEREQLFGPLFSPNLEERSAYSMILTHFVPEADDVESWITTLSNEKLHCPIEVPGQADFLLALDELLVRRYVRLLRLTDAPSADVVNRLTRVVPADDHPHALALLRDPAWRSPSKQAWLCDLLQTIWQTQHGVSLLKLDFLTDLVRDLAEIDSVHLVGLTEKVLSEKRQNFQVGGSAKPFFSRHIEEWHGHGRDQRQFSEDEVDQKQRAIGMLTELIEDLKSLAGMHPA